MRALALMILTVAFAVAVIVPDDVGTHELPAARGKHLVAKAGGHLAKPGKSGPAASVVLTQIAGIARCSGCLAEAGLDIVPPAVSQHSSPLLI